MALEQTVSSTTFRNLLTFPLNPNSKPKFQLPCYPKHHWNGGQGKLKLKLKCSMDDSSYPKPPEIPWKKELWNNVNLIGYVSSPVEIKQFSSGKVGACTRLSIKKNATQMTWIHVTFWDDLAHVAYRHLQKGHQIHVSGRLVPDSVETDKGKHVTYFKVVAQQLNFIERSFPVSSNDQESDFMMNGRRKTGDTANITGSVVELWQAFFANPGEWWDNRKNKKNPRAPDFKHKDTGEALWIDGRSNPPWVKSQLEILDMRMGSLTGQNGKMPVDMMNTDEILSF
ncbi:Primosome PriB/single-strand DNA-binding [Sesbania bispinosa]|nr:Primosome PriB/single-strand DNA-binding [Sesbania bispinosa]